LDQLTVNIELSRKSCTLQDDFIGAARVDCIYKFERCNAAVVFQVNRSLQALSYVVFMRCIDVMLPTTLCRRSNGSRNNMNLRSDIVPRSLVNGFSSLGEPLAISAQFATTSRFHVKTTTT
jgi:hypothetical protein